MNPEPAARTAHTAGPWDYIISRSLIHVETRHDNPIGAGIHICSVPKSKESNAAFIASAPTLAVDLAAAVEALTKLLSFDDIRFADDEGPDGEGWQSDELSAAIANADAVLARCAEHAKEER